MYIKDKKRILLLSQTDQLTGLYNRLHFNDLSYKEIERSKRYQNNLSLIFMDIDHFKQVNDTYGHLVGDDILKKVSEILKQNVRKYDILSRWGGEEFALLLPQTSRENAFKVAEKIQKILKEHQFTNAIVVTLSFGISDFNINTQTIDDLFIVADKNLYIAKTTGRNKIVG